MSNIKDNLLQLIGKTPLVRLSNIYKDEYGTEIIAKVEYFNPGGSVKDRAAYAMIEAAETSGKLKKDGTIIEPTSGNTAGHGDRYIGSLFRVDEPVPDDSCLQIHLRTCQVDHDCKAIRAEYLHREPSLCKTLQNRIRIRILSFRFESAYYLKSHRGVRGWWLHIDVVLLLFTESCY